MFNCFSSDYSRICLCSLNKCCPKRAPNGVHHVKYVAKSWEVRLEISQQSDAPLPEKESPLGIMAAIILHHRNTVPRGLRQAPDCSPIMPRGTNLSSEFRSWPNDSWRWPNSSPRRQSLRQFCISSDANWGKILRRTVLEMGLETNQSVANIAVFLSRRLKINQSIYEYCNISGQKRTRFGIWKCCTKSEMPNLGRLSNQRNWYIFKHYFYKVNSL